MAWSYPGSSLDQPSSTSTVSHPGVPHRILDGGQQSLEGFGEVMV
jgi:hypothetical protein